MPIGETSILVAFALAGLWRPDCSAAAANSRNAANGIMGSDQQGHVQHRLLKQLPDKIAIA